MKHFTTTQNTRDGLELMIQGWEPELNPRAVVCLVHGLGEHSGRYAHVAEALTSAGLILFAHDLRGHGRSEGKRGHIQNVDLVLDDIDRILDEAARRYPDLPRFLYGHSLGGILTLNYVLKRSPALAGVVVTSPGLRTALEEQKGKLILAKVLGSIAPGLSLSSGLDASGISHDLDVVRAYRSDPLVHDQATLAFANSILGAIRYNFEHAGEFKLPLLMMHGSADPVAFASGSQEFARSVPQAQLKIWEGLYHELHNEIEKGMVIDYLLAWLNDRLRAQADPDG